MADVDRIAAALRYQQEINAAQRPATMNPNLSSQGATGRALVEPPTSVMDERYPAWKKSQDDAENLINATEIISAAIPLAGTAVKGVVALGKYTGPELARGLKNYTGKTLWHGGELLENPSGFNQGSVINGVPSVSTSPTALGAARYAIHNRGSINAIDPSNMKIYTKGANPELDASYNAADFGKLKSAGFDAMDLRSFGHGNEIVIFDPALALKNKVGEAQMANRIRGGKFFDELKPN